MTAKAARLTPPLHLSGEADLRTTPGRGTPQHPGENTPPLPLREGCTPLMPWGDPFYSTTEWQRTSARILKRDNRVCYICRGGDADQTDHITPRSRGGADTDDNLAAIHSTPCHRDKSLREAQEALVEKRRIHGRKRPPQRHPGLTS